MRSWPKVPKLPVSQACRHLLEVVPLGRCQYVFELTGAACIHHRWLIEVSIENSRAQYAGTLGASSLQLTQ